MRSVWIALAAILATSLLGALLLARALDKTNHPKPLLTPRGARVLEDRPLAATRVVTWHLGGHAEEPSTGLYGVTIWRDKRRLYEHRATPKTVDIGVETGDFSGDRRSDLLLFEHQDGSGDCVVYRALVIAPASIRQIYSRRLCREEGSIRLGDGGLVFRLGAQNRTTVRRWNGHRLVVVRRLPT
jgi:hypothetical protein